MATPNITLIATLDDILGAAAGSVANPAILEISLCGYGGNLPRIAGTSMLAAVKIQAYSTGAPLTILLWANDQITPAGTYYQISVVDGDGNIVQTGAYQFTGTHTYDLSTLTPFIPYPIPPPPPGGAVLLNPPGGLGTTQVIHSNIEIQGNLTVDGSFNISFGNENVAFSATPVFNGDNGMSHSITLTGNVTSSTAVNLPNGLPITFMIFQDATGGRTFVWPATFRNTPDINPAANGVTTQAFIKGPDGNFYPAGGATWS